MALVELRDGNLAAARSLAAAALRASKEAYGADNFRTADAGSRLGQVELAAGNYALARELLTEALAVEHVNEADRGVATFTLARAAYEDPDASTTQRARGIELAREAVRALDGKPAYTSQHGEAVEWLEAHERER